MHKSKTHSIKVTKILTDILKKIIDLLKKKKFRLQNPCIN